MRRVWINCSEASGDMYAGALAEELLRQDSSLKISGMGGPRLSQAGAELRFPMSRLCFTGFKDVLFGLPDVFRLHKEITKEWEQDRPDAIVMVDCPDFNLPLAKAAHAMGIPVLYFIAPQLWAWRQKGLKTLRRCVRNILCALPFEPAFFRNRGCSPLYAGHPLLDMIPLHRLDKLKVDAFQIGIMPGSRKKEIAFLLPEFAEAAGRLHREMPWTFFSIARAPGISRRYLKHHWPPGIPAVFVDPIDRFQMIRRSNLILAASGTATLETGLIGTPTVVAYKIDPPAAFIMRKLALSKLASLTNILLNREIFPEYLQERANAENYYTQMKTWLGNPSLLLDIRKELQELRHIVGPSGSIRAAAERILAENQGGQQ